MNERVLVETNCQTLTVQGGCIQGSPSICMGSRREVLKRDTRRMRGETLVWGAEVLEVGKGCEGHVSHIFEAKETIYTVTGQGQTLLPLFP